MMACCSRALSSTPPESSKSENPAVVSLDDMDREHLGNQPNHIGGGLVGMFSSLIWGGWK